MVALPLGTLLAVLITRSDVAFGRTLATAWASQLAVPLYVFAGGWSAGLGLQGWMRISDWLGPTGVGWMQGWLGSLLAVGLIHGLACISWVCLIVWLGMLHSDRNEEQMAWLEGGWPGVVRHVWMPRLRLWLIAAALWCLLGTLTEMSVSNLFVLGTVAELVYLDVSRAADWQLTYVAAIGLCMLPVLSLAVYLLARLPGLTTILDKPLHYSPQVFSLGRWQAAWSLMIWTVTAMLVGIPIWNLLVKAGWQPGRLADGQSSYWWSLSRLGQTAIEAVTLFQSEYYWSMMLASGSTSLTVLTSGLLYWMTGVRPVLASGSMKWSRRLIHFLMLAMIAIPGPLVGSLVTGLLNRPNPEWLGSLYYGSLAAPILAQQFRMLPLCWLMLCAMMASIPQRSWELAQSDALRFWPLLRTVLWPHTRSYWLTTVLLLMLYSIGELSCSIGVLPPGVTTTSIRLFEILHFGMRHQDSALCGLLILLGWGAAWILTRHLRARQALKHNF
ncbi:MAG TPA: hypothetical protein DCF63_06760 [Planctomycetaceae bacterium]|nr:hypothetical protein [Planctomycetaceae bacterium]